MGNNQTTQWSQNHIQDRMVIGVLGGMGSYATLHVFEKYLEKFKAEKEWDRPRMIIDNNCTMPSRVRAILYHEEEAVLINEIKSSVQNLINAGATDIFLACNTSHVFLEKIRDNFQNSNCRIHNIIDACINYLEQQKIHRVYLLATEGTIQSKVFVNKKSALEWSYSEDDFVLVREFIESVKQNQITPEIIDKFCAFVNGKKEDTIVLGCTELPVLYDLCQDRIKKLVVDPIDVVLDNLYQINLNQHK